MNILIAGDGKVGAMLTRQLSAEGHDITLIDNDADVLENSIEQYDVMSVVGNCASMETLRAADVRKADLLITATSSDETNLLCCMTAHGMNPNLHTIARIRTPEYSESVYAMREMFALSMTVNPEKTAAMEIDHLLKYPGFLRRETFAQGLVEIVEIRIGEKLRKLHGRPLYRLGSIVRCQVLVCAVTRRGETVIPSGDFILEEGDRIFVTASSLNLSILMKNLGLVTRPVRNAVIIGAGRLSYYLTNRLLKEGISVKIIDINEERCVKMAEAIPRACVVRGDASVHNTLLKEGVGESDAMINLTGMDELNIVLGLYGTSNHVPRVITKVGHTDSTQILGNLQVGSIVSPKELCCTAIVRYVRAMQNQMGAAESIHSFADGQAEALEFVVTEETRHRGEKLMDVSMKKNVLVASIARKQQIIFPKGDSYFEVGDRLVIISTGKRAIHQLNDIFAD